MTQLAIRGIDTKRPAATADIIAATGLDEDMIARVVHRFYARARDDALLGPVFESRIADWGPHLAKMVAFWSSVALMTGRYHGQPMEAHAGLPVAAAHFERWLALFEATARTECPPAAAEHLVVRARRIAQSLELGIARERGVLLGIGERLPADSWPARADRRTGSFTEEAAL